MNLLKEMRRMIMPSRLTRKYVERRIIANLGEGSAGHDRLMVAVDDARDMHRGKKRKNGEPVIVHERAMLIFAMDWCGIHDVDVLEAIMRHDLSEDYRKEWPFSRVERVSNRSVRNLVRAVTKPDRNDFDTDEEFHHATFARIDAEGDRAWLVKIVDALHNHLTPWGPEDKQVEKMIRTFRFILPKAAELNFLLYELTVALESQMKRLKLNHKTMQEL